MNVFLVNLGQEWDKHCEHMPACFATLDLAIAACLDRSGHTIEQCKTFTTKPRGAYGDNTVCYIETPEKGDWRQSRFTRGDANPGYSFAIEEFWVNDGSEDPNEELTVDVIDEDATRLPPLSTAKYHTIVAYGEYKVLEFGKLTDLKKTVTTLFDRKRFDADRSEA